MLDHKTLLRGWRQRELHWAWTLSVFCDAFPHLLSHVSQTNWTSFFLTRWPDFSDKERWTRLPAKSGYRPHLRFNTRQMTGLNYDKDEGVHRPRWGTPLSVKTSSFSMPAKLKRSARTANRNSPNFHQRAVEITTYRPTPPCVNVPTAREEKAQ